VEGPKGSLINHDDRDPNDYNRRMIKCGGPCGEWKFRTIQYWTGWCMKCLLHARRHTGEGIHPESGAKFYRDIRDPNVPEKVAADCTGCGERFFVQLQRTKNPTWRGLCSDCVKAADPPKLKTENEELINGAWILRNERDAAGRRLLYYVYPPKERGGCGCKRTLTAHEARTYKSKAAKGQSPLICRRHRLNPYLLLSEQSNGNGQVNGSGVTRGRKPVITEEKIRAAYKVLGSFAPQEKLAEQIGVDARSLRDWQRERGLTYPTLRQLYTAPEVINR
jgi:hypothetical protein